MHEWFLIYLPTYSGYYCGFGKFEDQQVELAFLGVWV
jgi:hypothetical protein